MSHNSYVRPLGVWDANKVVSHTEFALLDRGQFVSINGDDGGTWAPISPITIGGAGVTLELVGVSSVNDTADIIFRGGASLDLLTGSFATFSGEAAFSPGSFTGVQSGAYWRFYAGSFIDFEEGVTASFYGQLTLGPTGAFSCQGPFTLASAAVANFLGSAIFQNTNVFSAGSHCQFQGTENHSGTASFGGPLSITGDTALSSKVTTSGAGRIVKRTAYIAGTGGSITGYGPVNCDRVLAEGLTADSVLTIDNTGVQEGDEIEVTNLSGDFTLRVAGPAVFAVLKNAPSNMRSVKGIYISGHWRFFSGDNY